MGRGGKAGSKGEFNQGLSVRWEAGGGDSATRFRSAVESLTEWSEALLPWNFQVLDAFEFLDKCKDRPRHGLYVDAPWPDAGDKYTHRFDERQQRKLAGALGAYRETRVVIRYGDHPLIRELYPESEWTWLRQASRKQSNDECEEVLIINGPSYSK
jgi:hypothetical protein